MKIQVIVGDRFHQLKQLIAEFMDSLVKPAISSLLFFPVLRKDLGPRSPWGYFHGLQQRISELLYAEICDRRAEYDPNRTDILTLMLSARDEAGQGMSDAELHDELVTFERPAKPQRRGVTIAPAGGVEMVLQGTRSGASG